MKILVDNSGYFLGNIGDVSMLQAAYTRLKGFWPDASFYIITTRPDRLEKYCPGAIPVPISPGDKIFQHQAIIRLSKVLPSFFYGYLRRLENIIKCRYPVSYWYWMQQRAQKRDKKNIKKVKYCWEALNKADLVVATGGGYITDVFKQHAMGTLFLLWLAIKLKKKTAMLGHGLGPILDSEVFDMARRVLPKVDFLGLRESHTSVPLLRSLGMPMEKVAVTGDDSISIAFERQSAESGQKIGVNVRVASYSGIDEKTAARLQKPLRKVADRLQTDFVPVPISFYKSDSDNRSIKLMLGGSFNTPESTIENSDPNWVIDQIARCRVVITGSYHGAVFALSQGIPVIALALSQYYIDKFLGLANQFGNGCKVINLNDAQLEENLESYIDDAWHSAPHFRALLLEAAKRQISSCRQAYDRVYKIVECNRSQLQAA